MDKESKPAINKNQEHNSMLEYAKIILPKVSFCKSLFSKELKKCIHWVEEDREKELYTWCYDNFHQTYPLVISEAFAEIAA